MRIIFFGTPEFAVASLDKIVGAGYDVCGVVTMPDKPAGRGHKMFQSPVKEYAIAHNIPVMQPVKLKDTEFVEQLRSYHADLFVVIAFRMLPEVVWQMPPMGTFNLHASLLPRYRGAAPINWAVINGDTETGVTTFFLKHEIDTGDIIRQERVDILPTDNVGDVHDKLMTLGAELTVDTIKHLKAGDLTPIPQDELLKGEEPTPAPKIFAETLKIDWGKPALAVHNLIRGLSPYPAAHSVIADGETQLPVKIFASQLSEKESLQAPGTILIEGNLMSVVCGDGRILGITELQPSGKRRMPTADFLNGARLSNPHFIN